MRECLLIQISQSSEDMSFEYRLVADHMDALLENRLPEIARKMECSIDRLKLGIEHLSKLDTSPGLQVGRSKNIAITPDVIVDSPNGSDEFSVRLTENELPSLRLSPYYTRMAQDTQVSESARKFLTNNVRSAQWIIEAIEQRKSTLLKVAKAIVKHQQDFFEKGPLYLRPLPMSKIADEVGVHLATVSRAVSAPEWRSQR